jgi:tetratricopeptide (TPR) repeat protein
MVQLKEHWRTLLVCIVILTGTLATFWPVSHHDFINYDDPQYIIENPHVTGGLHWQNIKWAFGSGYASNWHPLTWLSHMLDVRCFGLRPAGHHLVGLLLHCVNALLLFFAFRSMTDAFWRSALVAALFALHPLHVESVAWAAERKDVLSAFFFMLTLFAYARYARQVEMHHPRSIIQRFTSSLRHPAFISALICFIFGLMSKPILVTVPFILLLLDYWPLHRLQFRQLRMDSNVLPLVVEKLPFFALTVASSIVTFLVQKTGGAALSLEQVPLASRLANGLVAYFHYLVKLFYPVDLSLLYLPARHWPPWEIGVAALIILTVTFVILGPGRKLPFLTVGWLWFLGMLVPVIGLIQVGAQFMADRYTYLPLIGCFIILSWGGWELASKWHVQTGFLLPSVLLVLLSTAALSRRQVGFWENSETLFSHCLEVTTDNYVLQDNLASALAEQGRVQEAKVHFLEALRIRPNDCFAFYNLGILLATQNQFAEAAPYLKNAVDLEPQLADVYGKLGYRLASEGKLAAAISYYKEWVKRQPDQPMALNDLAWTLATVPDPNLRNGKEAVHLAQKACDLTRYEQPSLIGTLAAAYAEAGSFPEAVKAAEKAIALATSSSLTQIAERNRQLLALYREGRPYHEHPPGKTNSPAQRP